MVSLLAEKAASRSSVHLKGVFGLSKCLKGDIISVLQKHYATWFTTTLSLLRYCEGREVPEGSCVLGCGLDTILSDH